MIRKNVSDSYHKRLGMIFFFISSVVGKWLDLVLVNLVSCLKMAQLCFLLVFRNHSCLALDCNHSVLAIMDFSLIKRY